MGILNVTPDSFSDGGRYLSVDAAIRHALAMIDDGAAIIDIGAESTRPGSDPIDEQSELARLLPILESLPKDRCFISVDTSKLAVQAAVLDAGAHIINDVSGGSDALFQLAERHSAGLVLMHSPAPPKIMQQHAHYDNVLDTVCGFFQRKSAQVRPYRIPRIWADPGIGFGKELNDNLTLMRDIARLRPSGWGLLLGASRKRWIERLSGAPVDRRLPGSLAALVYGLGQGVDVFRVHDVWESNQALRVAQSLFHQDSENS